MSVFSEFLVSVPLSIAMIVVILRYAPTAVVTLVAGVVAALTSQTSRGERAVAVLQLLHGARQQHRPTSLGSDRPLREKK
ncbi:hypothetical protein [Amycolatopsis nigrescens]|uniref:hypothetical protein n=1 Tax=Amycolatopsis nigrescens TaxID=381445 RepID=UPI0012F7D1A7|nr:hypothetical protein [Amycolatopsis nigrescens]